MKVIYFLFALEKFQLQWKICPFATIYINYINYRTGKSYTINYELDCNSSNVVYLLSCKVCHVQYVGSATTKFGLSFTILRPVLERIQGFLLRVETRMIFYVDIFLARDTMVLRISVYS